MENFIYKNPTEIRFGIDVLADLGKVVKQYGSNVLFIYGMNSIKKSGLYDTVTAKLQEENIDIVEFSGVRSNPTLTHTREGIKTAIDGKIDVIVAVGGGSVIDEAKAISLGAAGTDPWDVLLGTAEITTSVPIISILTLPATASEMNGGFVITNSETNEKFGTGGAETTHPKVSFLDPTFTTTISIKQTAYSVADILSHLTEGYFTNTASSPSVTDFYIEGIAKSVLDSGRKLVKNTDDIDARASLMWASSLGWNGMGLLGLKDISLPCHALEHSMSGNYPEIAHGAGLSVITPAWLTFTKDIYAENILKFGKNVLEIETSDPLEVISGLVDFYKEIEAPTTWTELGIEPDYERLTKEARKLFDMWGIVKPAYSTENITEIYKLAE